MDRRDVDASNLVIGIDVGGTFTDLLIWNKGLGKMIMVKVPTTPENQGIGFLKALERSQVPLTEVHTLVHGTTVATNALIQRDGAICGLITTKGFRDILELRRGDRAHLYGLKGNFVPLIPREFRLEVEERTTAEGEVLKEVEEAQVLEAGRQLREAGVEAVVISFLHSHINPANEERARQILKTFWPNGYMLTSSEVLSSVGEFERTSTAVLNAYLQPLIHRYLEGIQRELKAHQFRGRLVLMSSYGGTMSTEEARVSPAGTVLSGPAGGVIAACHLAQQTGYLNVLSCDMGGTSCDVSVIAEGAPAIIDGKDLDFGIPLRLPMLDITTIGAGGGSIAWIDNSGCLRVGPQSAGAKPGPACYGRRGFKPTVTDANLILGRMNPESPILKSGGIVPDPHLAGEAIRSQVAAPLGITLEEAAFAILEIVNQNMTGLLRLLTIERGHNPGDFALVAFGGAGPLHAAFLAREVGIPRVLIPPYSGAFSAYGCMIAEAKQIFEQTLNAPVNTETVQKISHVFLTQRDRARERMRSEDVQLDLLKTLWEVEMGYRGQSRGIWIPCKDPQIREDSLRRLFEEAYRKHFGRLISEFPLEIKRLRTTVTCPRLAGEGGTGAGGSGSPGQALHAPALPPPRSALRGTRPVYFQDHFIETPIYERPLLPVGTSLLGPALVEQEDSTTVVPPEVRAEVDRYGNLILTVEGRPSK